jgi:hypothetical protein
MSRLTGVNDGRSGQSMNVGDNGRNSNEDSNRLA